MTEIMLGRGTSIDDKLLRYAVEGLSPEQISYKLDEVISPARVMIRTRELLKSTDWLTDAEQERALLRNLRRNLVELQDQALKGTDERKLILQFTKEIFARLDKRTASLEADLNTYSQNVGHQLGKVVDESLAYIRGALRDVVPAEKWDELVEEALHIAWARISEKQKSEEIAQ